MYRSRSGAQFDWRQSPLQWLRPGDTYDQLKAVIESFSARNGNEPVVALSISMGGPFFSLFLARHTDRAWRRRFIRRFVSVCGPYGAQYYRYITLSLYAKFV